MNLLAQLASMILGARVRAASDITYVVEGVTIAKGTEGTVELVTHAGALVGVQWQGDEQIARRTSFDSLEVLA